MARPRVADGRDGLQIWKTAANIFNNSHEQQTRSGSPVWGLGEGLTPPHRRKNSLLLRNVTQGLGRILWSDLDNGKWI